MIPPELGQRSDADVAGTARLCTTLLADFARTRDPGCFDELARRSEVFLRGRASIELRRLGLRLDVAEVVQETLLNFFRYAHTFKPEVPQAFATWARRVVRNVALRFLRRRRGATVVSIEEIPGFEPPARRQSDPYLRLEERERCRRLRADFACWLQVYFCAYQTLTDLQKRVLHLVEIDSMRYREVAARLGMRVEAVKMVIYRARRRLATLLDRAARG